MSGERGGVGGGCKKRSKGESTKSQDVKQIKRKITNVPERAR